MDNQVEFNEISQNTQTAKTVEEVQTESDEELIIQDETYNQNKKKSFYLLILGMAVIFIIIIIGSFLAAENSVDGKKTGFEIVDSFAPDYESEDEINILGNTNSNYKNGAWVAGQGKWTYCIVSNQIIKFWGFVEEFDKQIVWDGTNDGDVRRLSVCGDYLYFLSNAGLCRVRTDGTNYEVIFEEADSYIHNDYVVYDQKIYTSMSRQVSATKYSHYFIEYDCDDKSVNEIYEASDYEFIGADSGYLVFRIGEDSDGSNKMLVYRISDGTANKVTVDDDKVSFFLSDGNLYCLSSGWFGKYSIQNIQVVDLAALKTVRHINPDEGVSVDTLNITEGGEKIILGQNDGIGFIYTSDDFDFSKWYVINEDPSTNVCFYDSSYYYKCNERYYRTTSGNTFWGEITAVNTVNSY